MPHGSQGRSPRCSRPTGPLQPPHLLGTVPAVHLSPAGVPLNTFRPCHLLSFSPSQLSSPPFSQPLLWEDMPAQVGRPFAAALFCFCLSYSSHGPGTSVCFRNGAISTPKTHHLSKVPQAGEAQSSLPPEPGLFFADRLDHMSQRHSHLGPQPLLSVAQLLFQEGAMGPAQVSYPRRSPRPSVKQTFFSGPHLWD